MRSAIENLLLRLYPRRFRREYGAEWLDLARRRPLLTVALDTIRTVPSVWVTSFRRGSADPGAARPGPASFLDSVAQDVRFGVRSLRRRPFFSLLAVSTLGLGIGSATAMFSVVEGVLLRPLPYRDPGQLVTVWETFPEWREIPQLAPGWDQVYLAWPEYERWRDNQTSFENVAVYGFTMKVLDGPQGPERVDVGRASSSLLGTLGVEPFLGRGFISGEDGPDGERAALLDHATWQETYGSDSEILGRTITLNEDPFTVVGVLPPGFKVRALGKFPSPGSATVWIPLGSGGARMGPGSHSWNAVARLRQDVTVERAASETEVLLRGDLPPEEMGARLVPRVVEESAGLKGPLFLLLAGAFLLLAIGCGNVAILLSGEVTNRASEMAARTAVGAGGGRLVRQLLTESMILGILGGGFGLFLAHLGIDSLLRLAPAFPRINEVGVNVPVFLFAGGLGLGTGLLFGLAPGLGVLRRGPARLPGFGSRTVLSGQIGYQHTLLAAQLALTTILLTSTALLARSLSNLFAVDPGFRVENLTLARVNLPGFRYPDGQMRAQQVNEIKGALEALPGVSEVTGTNSLPFHGFPNLLSFGIEGMPDPPNGDRHASWRSVFPGFFEAMEIPILEGRALSDADRAGPPWVAVISETLANNFFPQESPLGARILFGDTLLVVGVAGDVVHESLGSAPLPTLYTPYDREPSSAVSFVVSSQDAPALLYPSIREAVWSVDRGIPAPELASLFELQRGTVKGERFRALLLLVFAGSAVVLAGTGVFGITARTASRRAREMAIRKTLGAETGGLVRMVATGTVRSSLLGVAAGLVSTLLLGNLIRGFLFGVESWDLPTYVLSSGSLLALSLLGSLLPSLRAGSVAPARVLREE